MTGQRRAATELVVELAVVEGQLLGAKFGAGASPQIQGGAGVTPTTRLEVAMEAAEGVTGVVAGIVATATMASLSAVRWHATHLDAHFRMTRISG